MTDREHEHWKDIQSSSHKEKLEYLLKLTKPGKNYFITPHDHSKNAVREFVTITDIDLERRAIGFTYVHEIFQDVWEGALLYYRLRVYYLEREDVQGIYRNRRMYRRPRGIQETGF